MSLFDNARKQASKALDEQNFYEARARKARTPLARQRLSGKARDAEIKRRVINGESTAGI
ncbi:hypothetical protein [Nonomuraea sp. NPDC050540]|uniref:hypothetical protein n=1 Tax=Nonomuraea sp. NPDC050540 TaxID=3364367 RepID=UPI00379BF295